MMHQRLSIGRLLLIAFLSVAFSLDQLNAQTKLMSWLRDRVGERVSKDEKQKSADVKWQMKHFKDKVAQKRFVAALKKSRCNTCHVKGKNRSVCNPFGTELSKLLRAELKMGTKEITAAMKGSAPEDLRQQVQAAFYKCLDKSLKSHVNPKDNKSETLGERIKRGDLPSPPTRVDASSKR